VLFSKHPAMRVAMSCGIVGILFGCPTSVHAAGDPAGKVIAREPGSVVGLIKAEDGHPLANATVTAKGANAERLETKTDAQGKFAFPKLKQGRWQIVADSPSMLSKTQTIEVASGKEQSIEMTLEDLEVADVLRVTGTRTLIHPTDSSDSTFVNKDTIDKWRSGNSLRDVIETAPGVSQDSFGNMVVRGEHNTINFVLDDVVLPAAVGQLQQGQLASPHSLQSMEVTTGGYKASAGGGPMGAIVSMNSLAIGDKPIFQVEGQLGGPIQGGVDYLIGSPLSLDAKSKWNRVRVQSSGQILGTHVGLSPPTRHWTRNGRADINSLSKLEWEATERDKFTITASFNESWMQIPSPIISRGFGFIQNQHDRQNFLIVSHKHIFKGKYLDESNLHLVNGFSSQRLNSTPNFNPDPIINGEEQGFISASPNAKRSNYIFSAQGDVRKLVLKTHAVKAGFFSEITPVRTSFSSIYYQADRSAENYGQVISPFTGDAAGPQLAGNVGKYKGFRYLQSAYLQDTWSPQKNNFAKRFTFDAGVRFDLYHGVYGNTLGVANAIAPFVTEPFALQPFKTNKVTNAQVSGRFGAAVKLSKSTVVRGSFANVFTPPPVDLIVRPFDINEGTINGVFNGSLRPMQATRGYIADVGLEQQMGPRFAARWSMYYKNLKNVGDELPVNNTILYQRLTLAGLEGEGVEARLDLRPSRDNTGLFGFVSNTVMVAKLTGNHKDSGGIYDIDPNEIATAKYIDHDRRETLAAALGWRTHGNFWIMANLNYWTGFLNGLDPNLFGAHPARTRPLALVGLNIGYEAPKQVRDKNRWLPTGVTVRIQNIANNVSAINLGSPFQGTRYTLPIQVLAQTRWAI
jgi:outer membrane receptor protein involved in Fe transport